MYSSQQSRIYVYGVALPAYFIPRAYGRGIKRDTSVMIYATFQKPSGPIIGFHKNSVRVPKRFYTRFYKAEIGGVTMVLMVESPVDLV